MQETESKNIHEKINEIIEDFDINNDLISIVFRYMDRYKVVIKKEELINSKNQSPIHVTVYDKDEIKEEYPDYRNAPEYQ